MEKFKSLDEIQRMDMTHLHFGQITGRVPNLEKCHKALSEIELHAGVPEDVRGQFNVARNMALYQYFMYALAPEVQMKTFSVIELALRRRLEPANRSGLASLLRKAVELGLLKDEGFRHLDPPDPGNGFSRSLPEVLPKLRNALAHGSTDLTPDCIGHVEKCADLVNQLFLRRIEQQDAAPIGICHVPMSGKQDADRSA